MYKALFTFRHIQIVSVDEARMSESLWRVSSSTLCLYMSESSEQYTFIGIHVSCIRPCNVHVTQYCQSSGILFNSRKDRNLRLTGDIIIRLTSRLLMCDIIIRLTSRLLMCDIIIRLTSRLLMCDIIIRLTSRLLLSVLRISCRRLSTFWRNSSVSSSLSRICRDNFCFWERKSANLRNVCLLSFVIISLNLEKTGSVYLWINWYPAS